MKIIALEGLDKSGKHTISDMVAEKLSGLGYSVVKSEFGRYDTPTGKMIMGFLKEENNLDNFTHQVLLYSNKQEQQQWFTEFEKQGVDFLILDRYTISQFVYGSYFIQEDYAKGVSQKAMYEQQMNSLLAMSNGAMRLPDINIVLDVTPEVSMGRKGQHGDNDRYERDKNLLSRVRDHYLWLCQTRQDTIAVDATKSIPEVLDNTLDAIFFLLEIKLLESGFEDLEDWVKTETDISKYELLEIYNSYPVSESFKSHYAKE